MYLSILCVLLHVLLAGFFIRQAGLQGLIYASFFAAFINAVMLFMGLIRWDMMFDSKRLLSSGWKMAVASGALLAVLKMHSALASILPGPKGVSLSVTILLSVIVYFGLSRVLKSEEFFRIRPSSRP
jgi:peptidoglycan biosynthesis protein MviN/MurJ (putative lipid II flippase)